MTSPTYTSLVYRLDKTEEEAGEDAVEAVAEEEAEEDAAAV